MRWVLSCILIVIIVSAFATQAYAYLGPGLGAGTLAVVFGFIISIFLAVFAIIWYPIKRILIKFGLFKKSNEKL